MTFMTSIKKRLCEITLGTTLFGVGALGLLNVMASEPFTMLAPPEEYIPNFTAQDYAQNYKTPVGQTLAYLVYPGAKVGRYLHNKRLVSE